MSIKAESNFFFQEKCIFFCPYLLPPYSTPYLLVLVEEKPHIFTYDFDLLSHLCLEFNAVPSQGNSASKCYKHNTETQVTLAKHFFIMTSISYQIQTPSTDVAKVLSNGGFTFHSRMNETECLLLLEKKKSIQQISHISDQMDKMFHGL